MMFKVALALAAVATIGAAAPQNITAETQERINRNLNQEMQNNIKTTIAQFCCDKSDCITGIQGMLPQVRNNGGVDAVKAFVQQKGLEENQRPGFNGENCGTVSQFQQTVEKLKANNNDNDNGDDNDNNNA